MIWHNCYQANHLRHNMQPSPPVPLAAEPKPKQNVHQTQKKRNPRMQHFTLPHGQEHNSSSFLHNHWQSINHTRPITPNIGSNMHQRSSIQCAGSRCVRQLDTNMTLWNQLKRLHVSTLSALFFYKFFSCNRWTTRTTKNIRKQEGDACACWPSLTNPFPGVALWRQSASSWRGVTENFLFVWLGSG